MAVKKPLEVKYVKMPITIEQKHEYNKQGFRVVDERFKPANVEETHVEEEDAAPKRRRKTKED